MRVQTKQTRKKGLLSRIATVFLCAFSFQAYTEMPPPAGIEVNVTVVPIVELQLATSEGIVMTTVTRDWMNKTRTSQGSIGVGVMTNFRGTLRCHDTVLLTCDSLSYTVPIGIMLMGVSSAYYSGDYICLDFEPGTYVGASGATLAASLTKPWSYGDAPGTYRGITTLEFVPR